MKKYAIILALLLLTQPSYGKDSRFVEVIKGEQEGKQGWTFVYNLCVPMPAPAKCDVRKFGIFVPKGKEAIGLPYIKRSKEVITIKDARIEAEIRANLIENVKK